MSFFVIAPDINVVIPLEKVDDDEASTEENNLVNCEVEQDSEVFIKNIDEGSPKKKEGKGLWGVKEIFL